MISNDISLPHIFCFLTFSRFIADTQSYALSFLALFHFLSSPSLFHKLSLCLHVGVRPVTFWMRSCCCACMLLFQQYEMNTSVSTRCACVSMSGHHDQTDDVTSGAWVWVGFRTMVPWMIPWHDASSSCSLDCTREVSWQRDVCIRNTVQNMCLLGNRCTARQRSENRQR